MTYKLNRVTVFVFALSTGLLTTTLMTRAQDAPQPNAAEPAETDAAPPTEDAATEPAPEETPAVTDQVDPAIAAVRADIQAKTDSGAIDKSDTNWRVRVPHFPTLTFTEGASYYWQLKTNKGDMKLRLFPDSAPNHVANFVYLSELGFFDGLSFHRVITGFMAQGGCPLGTGTGSPAYRFDGEFGGSKRHDHGGLLSMANAGPGTDGSQFFITFVATPWLDGKHTIFGEVVEGQDVLKALEQAGSQSGATKEPLRIVSASVAVEK